jgi:hypothetical protein
MKINIPIVSEFIGKTIVSSMAITKQNEFRGVIEWDAFCIIISFRKSLCG